MPQLDGSFANNIKLQCVESVPSEDSRAFFGYPESTVINPKCHWDRIGIATRYEVFCYSGYLNRFLWWLHNQEVFDLFMNVTKGIIFGILYYIARYHDWKIKILLMSWQNVHPSNRSARTRFDVSGSRLAYLFTARISCVLRTGL